MYSTPPALLKNLSDPTYARLTLNLTVDSFLTKEH